MLSYPQVALSTLEAMYRLGKNICDEIEKFQPDVVIGLAHSGWLPVVVAQTLWAETRSAPFPPSMRTNIGQEKYAMYHARYGKSLPAFCCGECCWGYEGRGHYLAWVAEQRQWQKMLRKQIGALLPSKPKRVLVADDLFGTYLSGYMVLGLLDNLYPNIKARIFVGQNDLTDNLVTGWLAEFIPPLANEIIEKGIDSSKIRFGSPWQETFKPLINGTEDVARDSLDWQFITRESAAVKAAAEYVPVEIALSAPQWAKDLACNYALRRLRNEIKDDEVVEPAEDMVHLVPMTDMALDTQERLLAKAWLQGGISRSDIIQVCDDNLEPIKEVLNAVKERHEWHIHGQRPNEIYFPSDSFRSWTNAYHLTDAPESARPKILIYGVAEFLPDAVWAGIYPLSTDDSRHANFYKHLLDGGVNCVIDLTIPQEPQGKFSYRKTLLQAARDMRRKIEIEKFPLPFCAAPSQLQVRHTLKYITRALKHGQRVYIHAGYNLEGRTPLILACLLIERGYSPKRALAKVNAFWMKTLYFLIHSPLSEEQRQFILEWKAEK